MRTGPINRRAVADLAKTRAVTRQEDAVADRVLTEARRLAPMLTGTLRRSLTVEEERNSKGETEYRIGWDMSIADYGHIVEFGSEDTAPQPHLRPAGLKVKGL